MVRRARLGRREIACHITEAPGQRPGDMGTRGNGERGW